MSIKTTIDITRKEAVRKKILEVLLDSAIYNRNDFEKTLKEDQENLIKRMKWDTKRPPIYLDWKWNRVINPYFVYKFTWEIWLPIDFLKDKLEKEWYEWIWNDWCEFWWNSWKKIPESKFFRR